MTDINQTDGYIEGESGVWVYNVTEDDEVKVLTDADIEWHLVNRRGASVEDAYLTLDSDGVSHSVNPTEGEVRIEIQRGVTDGMNGHLWHRLIIDGDEETRQVWNGNFMILPQ